MNASVLEKKEEQYASTKGNRLQEITPSQPKISNKVSPKAIQIPSFVTKCLSSLAHSSLIGENTKTLNQTKSDDLFRGSESASLNIADDTPILDLIRKLAQGVMSFSYAYLVCKT